MSNRILKTLNLDILQEEHPEENFSPIVPHESSNNSHRESQPYKRKDISSNEKQSIRISIPKTILHKLLLLKFSKGISRNEAISIALEEYLSQEENQRAIKQIAKSIR